MGVDSELFWTFNPKDLSPFAKAFSMKRKQKDMEHWQQGMYTRLAVASAMAKGNKYPDKPIFSNFVNKQEEPDPEEQQALIRRRFMDHVALLNSRFRGEH